MRIGIIRTHVSNHEALHELLSEQKYDCHQLFDLNEHTQQTTVTDYANINISNIRSYFQRANDKV